MSNKLYGSNLEGYLVEGAGKSGYMKGSGKGFGDGKTSDSVKGYGRDSGGYSKQGGASNWFEGKKDSVGSGMRGPQGKL